jgi:hypothetical protein
LKEKTKRLDADQVEENVGIGNDDPHAGSRM